MTDIDKTTISYDKNKRNLNYNNAQLSTFIAPIVSKEYYVNNFKKDTFFIFTKDGDEKKVNNSDEILSSDIIISAGFNGENFMEYTEFMKKQYNDSSKTIANIFSLK